LKIVSVHGCFGQIRLLLRMFFYPFPAYGRLSLTLRPPGAGTCEYEELLLDHYIVASVQQQMRLPQTLEELRELQRRFLRAAQAKNARLAIYPELGGLMIAAPLLADFRSRLLKHADQGRRVRATGWQRFTSRLAGSAAGLFKASFEDALHGLLDVDAVRLWQAYCDVYSGLAREFAMVLVAPSIYAPDPIDGVIRNVAAVFSTDGALLGTQAKVVLGQVDERFCRPGSTWTTIRTDVGALGIMVGSDVLYPEVGRALAFQGAEVLVAQGASLTPTLYNKLRAGTLARMQDNQLFAVSSYMVGVNQLRPAAESAFIGRSAIFAPQELTPRFNGVLVEMGNQGSEGVVTAEWDFVALKQLWETSETPLRRDLPLPQVNKLLAALYEQVRGMPRLTDGEPVADAPALTESAGAVPAASSAPPTISLDDLPVIASVTGRWPLHKIVVDRSPEQETVDEWKPPPGTGHQAPSVVPLHPNSTTDFEEETDEMDALDDSSQDDSASGATR
jgi:predicted amidohydrolase